MDDFHGAAAQHVGRADDQRVADFLGQTQGVFLGTSGAVRAAASDRGRATASGSARGLRRCRSMSGVVPMMGTPLASRARASLSGVWPPYWTMTPSGFSMAHDFQHVFQRQRLEVQTVGGVVVGGDGFRVAVDHDGFVTVFAHGHGGMHAAVVELDALADAVRAAAEDHDLLLVGRHGLALVLVGRVHVGGTGGEFGGAGVDALVDRADTQFVATLAEFGFAGLQQIGQTTVGEALALQVTQLFGGNRGEITLSRPAIRDRRFP